MAEEEKRDKDKPLYTIGVIAEMLKVHPQTLRVYEREGLVKPKRTSRNTRLYSDNDVERLKLILSLTDDLGVNLAGVEIILNLREKMERMRRDMQKFLEQFQSAFSQRIEMADYWKDDAIVPAHRGGIVRMEKE